MSVFWVAFRLMVILAMTLACYWLTVVVLDAAMEVAPSPSTLRSALGWLWAASQPLAFGPLLVLFEAVGCYFLLARVIQWQQKPKAKSSN